MRKSGGMQFSAEENEEIKVCLWKWVVVRVWKVAMDSLGKWKSSGESKGI